MKPILIAVLLALSALACLNEPARNDTRTAAVTQSPPAVEDNDFLRAPGDATSCLTTCAGTQSSCLSAAEDAVSECMCFAASASCEDRCGARGGAIVQC